jgi:glyoxalase family protein
MNTPLLGLHHVTAITGDARRNEDFYTRVLGLKLVKRTVNFDDPGVEHLFYGDASGAPGTLVTFFAWPDGERGRHGAGAVGELAFSIPRSSLAYWIGHLIRHGVRASGPERQFGDAMLAFHDPDGLLIELVAAPEADAQPGWAGGTAPAEHAIRGLHHVTLWEDGAGPTHELLTATLGFRPVAEQERLTRYALDAGGPGALVQVRDVAGFWEASGGTGTVHHLALRTPDRAQAQAWQAALAAAGLETTPVIERHFFQSVYLREPGGAIVEIATDGPGFGSDERAPEPAGEETEWEALEHALPREPGAEQEIWR